MNIGDEIRLNQAKNRLAAITHGSLDGIDVVTTFGNSATTEKRVVDPQHGQEITELKATIARIEGIAIYRGAERQVVSALNARDMINHCGWSLKPTAEWRKANVRENFKLQT
jgi:hypothetical protein